MNEIETTYLNIPPENIVLLKSILESYDDLGIVRTIDKSKGDVAILCVPDLKKELVGLLDSIKSSLGISLLPVPENVSGDWFLNEIE